MGGQYSYESPWDSILETQKCTHVQFEHKAVALCEDVWWSGDSSELSAVYWLALLLLNQAAIRPAALSLVQTFISFIYTSQLRTGAHSAVTAHFSAPGWKCLCSLSATCLHMWMCVLRSVTVRLLQWQQHFVSPVSSWCEASTASGRCFITWTYSSLVGTASPACVGDACTAATPGGRRPCWWTVSVVY